MLDGESSSVAVMKVGSDEERNSSTVPDSEMLSPTATESSTLLDSENTNRPLETGDSEEDGLWMKNPLPSYCI